MGIILKMLKELKEEKNNIVKINVISRTAIQRNNLTTLNMSIVAIEGELTLLLQKNRATRFLV